VGRATFLLHALFRVWGDSILIFDSRALFLYLSLLEVRGFLFLSDCLPLARRNLEASCPPFFLYLTSLFAFFDSSPFLGLSIGDHLPAPVPFTPSGCLSLSMKCSECMFPPFPFPVICSFFVVFPVSLSLVLRLFWVPLVFLMFFLCSSTGPSGVFHYHLLLSTFFHPFFFPFRSPLGVIFSSTRCFLVERTLDLLGPTLGLFFPSSCMLPFRSFPLFPLLHSSFPFLRN